MTGARRQRVALVTDAIAPWHRGGKEQLYDQLAHRLSRQADVHVYTMKWWQGPAPSRNGLQYHALCPRLPLYRADRRSRLQAVIFALGCVRLLGVRVDVIEADHMPYLPLFVLKLVAAVRRTPLVVNWHEVWDSEQWQTYLGASGRLAWTLELRAARLPDRILATSEQTAERLRALGVTAPIHLAPGGIDLTALASIDPAPHGADIVSVGRLLSHKRHDLLLDALARLPESLRPTCAIVGDGPQRAVLERKALRLGLGDRVLFLGAVESDGRLLGLMKAARVCVFASEREGFGIAALEAIACGVPVITTSAPHNHARHLVERASLGVVCEPTTDALAGAITQVLIAPCRAPQEPESWVAEYDWEIVGARTARALFGEPEPRSVRDAHDAVSETLEHGAENGTLIHAPESEALEHGAENGTLIHAPASEALEHDADNGTLIHAPESETLEYGAVSETPPEPPEHEPAFAEAGGGWSRADAAASLLALALLAVLVQIRGSWPAGTAVLVLALTVPGFVLLRALCVPASAVRAFPIYIVAGSLVTIMATGLGVDLIGPLLGVARPLRVEPLTVGLAGTGVLLTLVAAVRRAPPLLGAIAATVPPPSAWWPVALPVLSWIGAERLNNGHGTAVAIVAVSVTGAALLAAILLAPRASSPKLAMIVFCAGLALMWGFSLRGRFVYGFDISSEYQTFVQTLHAGRWHALHRNDAYGAMLSLTILPSTIAALTSASPLVVLKVIFPVIFALFPVALLRLADRLLSRRFAFLAVIFLLVQSYLFQQLPAIARQEIGLLMFVCLVYALIDDRLATAVRAALVAILGLGLVVSHYGTTYLAIAFLAIALVLELIHVRVRRPARSGVAIVGLTVALVTAGVGAAVWYVPVTKSSQNLSQFVSRIGNQGLDVLPNAHGGILSSYLSGNAAESISAARFTTLAIRDYRSTRPFVHPLPQAGEAKYALHSAPVPGDHKRFGAGLAVLNAGDTIVSQLCNLLAGIGAILLFLRSRYDPWRRTIAVLGLGAIAALVVVRFSGTAALDYNQERAFVQAMVPLAVCMAWLLEYVAARLQRPRLIVVGFALGLALVFLTTSGLNGVLLGGGSGSNVTAHGEDVERFVVNRSEVEAARWLNEMAPPDDIVAADRYGALRILAATGRVHAVLDVLTPETLDQHAWVYADTANLVGGRARGQEGSQYAVYHWPTIIGRYWNLVYDNGRSAVYLRTQ